MLDIDARLQAAVQSYWMARKDNSSKQRELGRTDAGTRGEVTGGTQMAAFELLLADILCDAGLTHADVRIGKRLELPGYFRGTKKWDLMVISEGQLVLAMEFKSQAGESIGKNINNRTEEALGSAKDFWTAFREGRFGGKASTPFLGYLFLLEDGDRMHTAVSNKEPNFEVDPVFRGLPAPRKLKSKAVTRHTGVSYAARYELLCRRLVLERVYSASCFLMATNSVPSVVTQPANDLSFAHFAAALRGHVLTFLDSQCRR